MGKKYSIPQSTKTRFKYSCLVRAEYRSFYVNFYNHNDIAHLIKYARSMAYKDWCIVRNTDDVVLVSNRK